MSTTSDFDRGRIIALYQTGTKSNREIAAHVGRDRRTVDRIIQRFEESGNTEANFSNCGRPRVTTDRLDRTIVRLSKEDPKASSSDLTEQLSIDYGVKVDSSTVRRRLLEANRPAVRPINCPVLTSAMMARRLKWARDHANWSVEDWSKVMFSDETCIEVQPYHTQYVRRSIGETPSKDHFSALHRHPVKVMLWSCMSIHGTGRVHVVEGSMNKEQYLRVLEHSVIPQSRDWWPSGSWIFQQDLAPCHTAKVCKDFLSSRSIEVLEWPGNSPDLNVIENLWHVLKMRINKQHVKDRRDIIRQALNIMMRDNDLKDICVSLVESMPRRVAKCIECKGGPLKY